MPGFLTRFEFTALKDKSPSDKAQVPAAATISFHPQGPLLLTDFNFPHILDEPQPIQVHLLAGDVRQMDNLAMGRDTLDSAYLTVDSVQVDSHSRTATLRVYNSGPISGQVGDRLAILTRSLACHTDPRGTDPGLPSISTDPDTGRGGCYLQEQHFDFMVSISGLGIRFYRDEDGGFRTPTAWVNAADYSDLQEAVDALPAPFGGVVYIPAGQYTHLSAPAFRRPLVLPPDRPVRLVGDGQGQTVLRDDHIVRGSVPAYDPIPDYVQVAGDNQSIEDIEIMGDGFVIGAACGVRITRSGVGDQVIFATKIKNC